MYEYATDARRMFIETQESIRKSLVLLKEIRRLLQKSSVALRNSQALLEAQAALPLLGRLNPSRAVPPPRLIRQVQ